MKRNIITVVGFLALAALGADDWISDSFENFFPSVIVQTNGIELTFKHGMQLGFLTNNINVGNTRDYPGCFIRYGDRASFYHHHGGLSFKPLDVGDQRKKFRIINGSSFPGGRIIRREATLLADMGAGAAEGSIAFTNEVIYESTNSYSYKVVATRNLEPGKFYEDYVDTNTLRILQAQGYYLDIDNGKSQAQPSQQLMEAEVFEESQLVKDLVLVADEKEDISKRRESTVGGEATSLAKRFLPVVFIVILLPVSWFFWKRHKR